jgi:hypothetical protein
MTRVRSRFGTSAKAIALRTGHALVFLCMVWCAPNAHAYPMYDDGAGKGCVSCHDGFQGGNGPLHFQHRTQLGITTCNVCHSAGGGSTPVRTYWSGEGGGFGCAGCHGQDYGETSPDSGQPKATSYGLRLFHVNQGITTCGTSGCHKPGALGSPDPFPTLFGENVPPPYYQPMFSRLRDPCSSADEDMPYDADLVGLDNDGDGLVDAADPDCAAAVSTTTTTTSTTTTTTVFGCGPVPAVDCVASGKGVLLVSEKRTGKGKFQLSLSKLRTAVTASEFGNPVTGRTSYKVCIYDGANQLKGVYTVARAGGLCGRLSCWSTMSDRGYEYTDKSTAADGILKIKLSGGRLGKGNVQIIGKNTASTLPRGIAASLQSESGATVQVLTSDASCFGTALTRVKKANGLMFSAVGP